MATAAAASAAATEQLTRQLAGITLSDVGKASNFIQLKSIMGALNGVISDYISAIKNKTNIKKARVQLTLQLINFNMWCEANAKGWGFAALTPTEKISKYFTAYYNQQLENKWLGVKEPRAITLLFKPYTDLNNEINKLTDPEQLQAKDLLEFEKLMASAPSAPTHLPKGGKRTRKYKKRTVRHKTRHKKHTKRTRHTRHKKQKKHRKKKTRRKRKY